MRHLLGVVLAIVLAAAIFFAASWGYLKLLIGPARLGALPAGGGSLLHDRAVLEGFGALLAIGLVAGILIAVPRISPLASGLPGLVLLAWTGLYLFSVRRAVRYIPLKTRAYGAGFEAMLFDGVLALAGLVMIIPLFVPSRWRRGRVAASPPAPGVAPVWSPPRPCTVTAACCPTGPRPRRSRRSTPGPPVARRPPGDRPTTAEHGGKRAGGAATH